jgi:hypothetical protein
MVVPFLGYIILLGSISGTVYSIDLSAIGIGEVSAGANGGLRRLKMTYLGLSIIGYATILFRLACPSEISKSKDLEDYILSAPSTSFPDDAKRKLDYIKQKFWYEKHIDGADSSRAVSLLDEGRNTASRMHHDGQKPPLDRDDWLNKNINSLNSINYMVYEIKNYSKLPVRYVIFILYSIGFITTLIPSFEIFFSVFINTISYL